MLVKEATGVESGILWVVEHDQQPEHLHWGSITAYGNVDLG